MNHSFKKTFHSFSQEFKLKCDFITILDIVIKRIYFQEMHFKVYFHSLWSSK